MNYNIINEYIEFISHNFLNFFKVTLGYKYQKNLCQIFIDKYIEVRYYNETNYFDTKDFINRINKELIDLAEKIASEDNIEDIKNIIGLFGYIVYFDDVNIINNEMDLIDSLVNDNIIKINNKSDVKDKIKKWCIELRESKDKFNNTIHTKQFNILEKRIHKDLYYLELKHNIKVSNLYSEYAINKAYNSGTIAEDKLFVLYILTSFLVLNNAINLDFSKFYLVPFSNTLFEKEKKCARLLNVFDNQLAKKFISIRITYSDYKKNKKIVDSLISQGYRFSMELDSSYTGNIEELVLFPYIFVYDDSPECEMLLRYKERLKSIIIKV